MRQGPKGGPFGPKYSPKGNSSAAKAGLRYERALARALGCPKDWSHGMWLEWEDSAGVHWCQPDLVTFQPGLVICLEAKLRWTLEGHRQLEELYLPLLGKLVGGRVIGAQVCKFLLQDSPPAAYSLEEALRGARPLVHWLGGKYFPLK